jgi:glycine betaine/proline transport system substrate-binding protein
MNPTRRQTLHALGASAAAVALSTIGARPAHAAMLTIGHPALSFYEVTAAVIQLLFERQGFNVSVQSGSHAQMFPKVAQGQVDLFVAVWLPDAHRTYWDEYKSELVEISTLYDEARLYWAVPAYVPPEVRAVADLAKPEIAARMHRTIRSTLPDSGLSMGGRKIFDHYRLAEAGWTFETGPAKEWLAHFEQQIAAKADFVMPLWTPQWLNRAHKLRVLDEPQGFLGGPNRVALVASKEWARSTARKQIAMLKRVSLSLKAVTEMDLWVNVERMSPRDAARKWISNNPNTVNYWITESEEDGG